MGKLKCPLCGSGELKTEIDKIKISEPYGGERYIDIKNYVCQDCDFAGDISNENDALIESELKQLMQHEFCIIADYLENEEGLKIRLIDIERILGLPFTSLGRNKPGQESSDPFVLAILKFIRRFPWLLKVAEAKFDYQKTHEIFMNSAYDESQDVFYGPN